MKTYEYLEQDVLRAVRDTAGEHVARKVMRSLMRMPTTIPEDNVRGLYSFWDSICYQMQVERSYFFDIYLIDVDKQVDYQVMQLAEHEIKALWLATDEAFDTRDNFELSVDNFIDSVVLKIRNEYLLTAAEKWTNKNIRKAKGC